MVTDGMLPAGQGEVCGCRQVLQPATRNPQPATRNPQPATRNPQPATRNPQCDPMKWQVIVVCSGGLANR